MANSRRLIVEIVGDSRSLERTFARSGRAAQGFSGQMDGISRSGSKLEKLQLGRAFAGGIVAGAGVQQLKAAVDVASNLNEQVSKSGVVFGSAAADVQKWADSTASSIGLANDKALEAAGTYGLLFRNIGEGEAESARLSQSLVTLASDLASFNNTSLEESLDAIRSGLTGEIEPLRKFGVFLSEARTKTQALADTGKTAAASLTTQDKVLARYKLLLQDTSLAQGDFSRTSEGLANQQRILAAQSRDLQASIGSALVPALTDVVLVMNEGIGVAEKFAAALDKIPGAGPGGGKDGKKGGILGTGVTGSDLAIIPLFKTTADLLRLLKEPSTSEKTTAAAAAFAKQFNPGFDPGPKPTGPDSVFSRSQKAVEKLPVGFQNTILKAENENDRGALTKALVKGKQFYQAELQKAIDADDSKAVNEIRGNLNGIQSAIQGVYGEISAETAKAKAATSDATGKQQAAAAKAAAGYRDQLALVEGGLELAATKAEGTKRENAATLKLIAFYRKESHDPKLSLSEAQSYAQRLADAVKTRAKTKTDDAAAAYRDQLALTEGSLDIAASKAEGTKRESAATRRLIQFFRKESTDPKLSALERQSYAQRLSDAVKDYQRAIAGALDKQTEELKKRAETLKSGVLDVLDRQQDAADTSRALRDAQDQLRIARVTGGKIGIRNAVEGLADARRDRARFLVEGASFSGRAAGGVNVGSAVFNINGAKSPQLVAQEVLAILQRKGKQRAPQMGGRNPGGIYGIPH